MFVCSSCGYRTAKWLGRCPACATWGAIQEHGDAGGVRRASVELRPMVRIDGARDSRAPTGLDELDRVLGGGLVAGAVILLAGEPGIGKSTLTLQAASSIAGLGGRVLYVSGEESASQLRTRGDRLGVTSERLLVATETDVESLLEQARGDSFDLLAVDSIQAVRCGSAGAAPGSTTQVREAAARFVDFAKATSIPVLLVGHVTKDGSIAGPRALEHLVDTVVHFEGDRHHEHRILRALKNRFGPSDELGVFRMNERGLVGVANPSELFLTDRGADVPGSAVLAAVEGTRPLLVEVQALVGEPVQGSPRRTTIGVDPNRVALVLAVLQRYVGLELAGRDVFVNVTGGLGLTEPAADLAVAAAVGSSALGRPLGRRWTVAGELGLTGEVRAVSRAEARLREAVRLGFSTALTPPGPNGEAVKGIRRLTVRGIEQAFRLLFD